jgi:hypothetical protein
VVHLLNVKAGAHGIIMKGKLIARRDVKQASDTLMGPWMSSVSGAVFLTMQLCLFDKRHGIDGLIRLAHLVRTPHLHTKSRGDWPTS